MRYYSRTNTVIKKDLAIADFIIEVHVCGLVFKILLYSRQCQIVSCY